jgi:hypothetical protein
VTVCIANRARLVRLRMRYDADGRRYDWYVVVARVEFVNVSEVAMRACVSALARLDGALSAWPCRPLSRSAATVLEHGLSAFLSAPCRQSHQKTRLSAGS